MDTLNRSQKKDIKLLGKFVEVYCTGKHSDVESVSVTLPDGLGDRVLCPECAKFLEYAILKRIKCPLEDEKPSCKHCRIHCYDTAHREKVRKIMSYTGRKLMMKGRVDYIWHYFF